MRVTDQTDDAANALREKIHRLTFWNGLFANRVKKGLELAGIDEETAARLSSQINVAAKDSVELRRYYKLVLALDLIEQRQ